MAKKKGEGDFFIGPQPIVRRGATPMARPRKKPGRAGKRGLSPGAARRVVRRAPEVMVRITGKTKGLKHMVAHLRYIHRNGKLEGETSDGSIVIGSDAVSDLAREWFSRREGRPNGRQERARDTVNMIFSMPAGTPRDVVTDATRDAAAKIFGGKFDYVMVTHTDTDHPHVHLTALARGLQGQRLQADPADLQRWREIFAECIRERGVEAEATPRDVRGVVRKSPRLAIFHIEKRGAQSDIRISEVRDAIETVTGQVAAGERPWEAATKNRQARVRAAWLAYADKIEQLGDTQLMDDARAVRAFVAAMPEPLTRRELVERQVRQRVPVVAPEQERGGQGSPDRERERE